MCHSQNLIFIGGGDQHIGGGVNVEGDSCVCVYPKL
jgi:hypothetical protein